MSKISTKPAGPTLAIKINTWYETKENTKENKIKSNAQVLVTAQDLSMGGVASVGAETEGRGAKWLKISRTWPRSASNHAWVAIIACWPSRYCLISAHNSWTFELCWRRVAATIKLPIPDRSDESLLDSSFESTHGSSPRIVGSTLGREVRMCLEPRRVTIPIEWRVSMAWEVMLPTTSCPSSQSMRPTPRMSLVMYGLTNMVPNRVCFPWWTMNLASTYLRWRGWCLVRLCRNNSSCRPTTLVLLACHEKDRAITPCTYLKVGLLRNEAFVTSVCTSSWNIGKTIPQLPSHPVCYQSIVAHTPGKR